MAKFSLEFHVRALARTTRCELVIPSMNLQQCLRNQDDCYYQNSSAKYPLLICLHGFGENEKSFQTNSQIAKLCEENGVAACFVNGENKWYLNMGPIEDFYSLIERDLLDFLYGTFRVLDPEMPLAIMGVSMGGYGTLYHYLKNTDKYFCAAALSPATKPDFIDESKYGTLRELFLNTKGKPLNLFLSIGENDFIIDASKELDQFLKDNGIDASYQYVPGKDHSWTTWLDEIPKVFDYFKKIKMIKTN